MQNFKALLLFILLSTFGISSQAQNRCEVVFNPSTAEQPLKLQRAPRKLTLIEQEFTNRKPPLEAKDQLLEEISKLRKANPSLAEKVVETKREKERGHSIRVNLSQLPTHMIFFLEGVFEQVVGARGLSKPFMNIYTNDNKSLIIHHEGDQFPLMVRWSNEVTEVQSVRSYKENDQIYQLLEVPSSMASKKSLSNIPKRHIYSLIAGSALNKFISSADSPTMTIASLLHEGRLVFDRPTQIESKELRKILDEDSKARAKVASLLFVAPTASGKTRVLGDAIVNKVNSKSTLPDRKLIILSTKTPDLTGELAKSIGSQLYTEVGPTNYRLIQWGGQFSEEMTLKELINFVDSSDVPVVLITSYPTIGVRAPTSADKANLLKKSRLLAFDEAHNATGTIVKDLMTNAMKIAKDDRASGNILSSLDIFGVTASPITKSQRTSEVFDQVFWAAIHSPRSWTNNVIHAKPGEKASNKSLEWIRMAEQYNKARDRGEINAADAIYYKPEERGFDFASIFSRGATGTQSSVNIQRLKQIWPDVEKMIEGHGPGVIQTYPRDAEVVAKTLSEVTGKKFISLQKLNAEQRALVYDAFKNKTEYQGQKIDAIVGTIREGLDFPQAGWYLSFKKYVKFPENIQGPGRVVRLALNKLSPVIIFFGEEVDKVTYREASELVMSRLGSLPRRLPEGRLYSGMRKANLRSAMAKSIENLNVGMEALIRLNSGLAKELGQKENLNPEAIAKFQNIVRDVRSSGSSNREIAKALDGFIFELYSYPFFDGNLKSTWSYCDKMISLEKKGLEAIKKARITEQDLAILQNPELMSLIKEFRSFYAGIGPVPRAVLEGMDLRLLNISEVAKAANAFVAHHEKAPYSTIENAFSLPVLLKHSIGISPDGIWRNLSPKSRQILDSAVQARNKISFEQSLEDFVSTYQMLPKFDHDVIDNNQRSVIDSFSAKLAEELVERLRQGEINLADLKKETLIALDESELYAGLALNTIEAVKNLNGDLEQSMGSYMLRLRSEGLLSYENLMKSGDFRFLQIIKSIDEADRSGTSHSRQYRLAIENALKSLGSR